MKQAENQVDLSCVGSKQAFSIPQPVFWLAAGGEHVHYVKEFHYQDQLKVHMLIWKE